MMRILVAAAFLLIAPLVCATKMESPAQSPGAALDARLKRLETELRCLVCQNQSIDDSAAPLAKDLRMLVRERLKAGDTDQQIEDFVVARYGEFVLLKPRFEPHTFLLWFATPVVFIIALLIVAFAYRRRSAVPTTAALSDAEELRLRHLLEDR